MADNIGVESKDEGITFDFKSTKGSRVKINYKPSREIMVSDKKAFEGYLKKVADSFEIVEKDDKPKPKTLDVVAEESEGDNENETA